MNGERENSKLRALGLHRRELRSWAMYDWANSAFATTIMAAVYPIYYVRVAGATLPSNVALAYWGYTAAASLLIISLVSPILGAVADYLGAKKKFLGAFMGLGVAATIGLAFVREGQWLLGSMLYMAGNIGFTGSIVFYASLLPHIARDEEMDRVAAGGWAVGYIGGGLLLAVNAAMLFRPDFFGLPDQSAASRASFASVAVWWAVFSIPLFRDVPEPPRRVDDREAGMPGSPLTMGFRRLAITFGELRQYRQLLLFLAAFFLYSDGIGTIIKMATAYGSEIGLGTEALIGALLVVQFVGIPLTFAFGALADRIGAKRGIMLALGVYTGISVFGYFVTEAWHFWVLAFAVGLVQGGAQALSRGLFASMIPRAKSSEFFAFFSVFEKMAGILGPILFGIASQLTGSGRIGILAIVVFFIAGILLLRRVDVDEGRRIARAEDASLHPPDPRSTPAARAVP
ncbi:MAG TPA: MFS transporter [Longimicrobiales bacterium]|nr:MFS transporter [Longimicrobiales bacterium]